MTRDGNAEARIQRDILEYLWLVAPQVTVLHVPNGAHLAGGDRAAARLKWQGMMPGAADLVLAEGPRVFFAEVKTAAGVLSTDQQAFRMLCVSRGHPWVLVRSVDEMRAALAHWNISTREAA